LGNTINALCRGQEHVPYRDSKLTRVLQESLSGNSITRVIVTCSILPSCKDETISSLKFANRIKTLKTLGFQNVKKINEQGFNKFMYQTLKISYQSCEDKL
jgi:kinesin family protein 5